MSVTNNAGQVVFHDPETDEEVIVTVVDASGTHLEDMTVIYQHGERAQYEAFFVKNEQGELMAADFFLHNSEHEIVAEPNVMHRANPDKARAIAGYVDDMKRRSRDFYQDTITCEEYDAVIERAGIVYEIGEGILEIFIHISGGEIISIFFGIVNKTEFNLPELAKSQSCQGQMDWYKSYSPAYGRTEFFYIQSQPPEMESVKVAPAVDGRLYASWLATDSTEYASKQETYKIDTLDHTIFLGPTEFSDLMYHYRILNENLTTYADWTETRQSETDLGELPNGTYTLEVYASDEVNNHSETMQQSFVIEESEADVPVVENEEDYCAPLRGPDILASETFADSFLCGNTYFQVDDEGQITAYLRWAVIDATVPFDSPPTAEDHHGHFRTRCFQADNLTTGELGYGRCHGDFGSSLSPGSKDTEARLTLVIPDSWTGDEIQLTFWIIEFYRQIQSGSTASVRIGPPRKEILSLDGKIYHECKKQEAACSFSQDTPAAYVYKITMQLP